MKIAVSGSTGLVGSAVCTRLEKEGHHPVPLVRSSPTSGQILWDPAAGKLAASDLEGLDAVVHLAGENIAEGRWTEEKKRRIRESRVAGTRLLCETLASMDSPPPTLIAASAIGYYGDRDDTVCVESTAPGNDFLASVCQQWEAATSPAREAGIRVVNLRIGVVLTPEGAALEKMLTPFKLGLGGVVGSGRQYWSWITLPELVQVIMFALHQTELAGPVNAVAPVAVTNREFTRILGGVLGRPTILPLPAFAAKLMMGEMAEALLLASTRVVPERLQASSYEFLHPQLEPALTELLK